METVFLIGRIVFSLIFLGSGIGQFADQEGSTQYAESKGVSNPTLMVQITSVCFLLGGAAIALGIFTDLAFLLTGVLVMVLAFTAHAFWTLEGEAQQAEMSHFMKNLTIFGACLMGFAFYAIGVEDNQLVGPLFDFDW